MAKPSAIPKARNIFAANLRRHRLLKGISQERLADIAGIHRTYVGSVERGERNISIDSMERLSNALSIPLVQLLSPSISERR
jgi:transcriptional regulator with XRE-family HTH domain